MRAIDPQPLNPPPPRPSHPPATVREAEHCWQRRNMMRVEESRSSRVSTDLQLLHSARQRAGRTLLALAHGCLLGADQLPELLVLLC